MLDQEVPLAAITRIATIDETIAERVREIAESQGCRVDVVVERGWWFQ